LWMAVVGSSYQSTAKGVSMGTLRRTMEDRLHSAESAAELLGVRPSTIRWWWATAKLPRVKIGRLSRVPESALWTLVKPEQRETK
jgi:excisionase family DNA binding protein